MEGGQTNEFRPLILVAEDDDSNFKLIKAIIGKKCDIQWAKNGEEIVALFKEYGKEAKAILMDIKMPCLLYTSPSPRDMRRSRMPSSA